MIWEYILPSWYEKNILPSWYENNISTSRYENNILLSWYGNNILLTWYENYILSSWYENNISSSSYGNNILPSYLLTNTTVCCILYIWCSNSIPHIYPFYQCTLRQTIIPNYLFLFGFRPFISNKFTSPTSPLKKCHGIFKRHNLGNIMKRSANSYQTHCCQYFYCISWCITGSKGIF